MHASAALLATLGLAASAAASAIQTPAPRAAAIQARGLLAERAAPTDAWVSVDDNGQPEATNTPSATVVDGSTSYENGAPHDLTATVFTFTSYAKVITSTGDPPNPTAVQKNGEGAFPRCHNTDGDDAPFCYPTANSTLNVGKTYFVTWDPDYFNETKKDKNATDNTLIYLRLDWYNKTSEKMEKIVQTDEGAPAKFGFHPLYIDQKYLKGHGTHNISLTILTSKNGSTEKAADYPTLPMILEKISPKPNEAPKAPTGHTLTIALPTVFGAILLIVIGGFLWNRKTRHIALGNVMSRARHGYTGRKSRRRFGRSRGVAADEANPIQLDTRDDDDDDFVGGGGYQYRDHPAGQHRRDSSGDGLGSLANSPVDLTFQQQGTMGGGNAFRDEIRRQERERR